MPVTTKRSVLLVILDRRKPKSLWLLSGQYVNGSLPSQGIDLVSHLGTGSLRLTPAGFGTASLPACHCRILGFLQAVTSAGHRGLRTAIHATGGGSTPA